MTQYARRLITAVLVVFLTIPGMLIRSQPVQAGATITVNTPEDEAGSGSACSLREAIIAANTDKVYGGCVAGNGADIIYLSAGTYELDIPGTGEDLGHMGDLDIYNNLTIVGAGQEATIISGNLINFGDRIFHIYRHPDRTAPLPLNVFFSGLKIKGGGVQTLQGAWGGGILNDGGNVNLSEVTLEWNAAFSGGGIMNHSGSVLTIINSTFYKNFTYNGSGTGGGILNEGTMKITASVFDDNQSFTGAAIDNRPAEPYEQGWIVNSTFANNDAYEETGAAGITASKPGKLILENITIAKNETGYGLLMNNWAILEIKNSLISNCVIQAGTAEQQITSYGYNLINFEDPVSGTLCTFSPKRGDLSGSAGDPKLKLPLVKAKYTSILEFEDPKTSPAVDALDVGDPNCPHVDQLLHGRPAAVKSIEAKCDIGAYEVGGTSYTTLLPLVTR